MLPIIFTLIFLSIFLKTPKCDGDESQNLNNILEDFNIPLEKRESVKNFFWDYVKNFADHTQEKLHDQFPKKDESINKENINTESGNSVIAEEELDETIRVKLENSEGISINVSKATKDTICQGIGDMIVQSSDKKDSACYRITKKDVEDIKDPTNRVYLDRENIEHGFLVVPLGLLVTNTRIIKMDEIDMVQTEGDNETFHIYVRARSGKNMIFYLMRFITGGLAMRDIITQGTMKINVVCWPKNMDSNEMCIYLSRPYSSDFTIGVTTKEQGFLKKTKVDENGIIKTSIIDVETDELEHSEALSIFRTQNNIEATNGKGDQFEIPRGAKKLIKMFIKPLSIYHMNFII